MKKAAPANMRGNVARVSQSFEAEWAKLSARYLPFAYDDSPWKFSRPRSAKDPEQGWKLHISATIISASRVLKTVAPFLTRAGVLFKAPRTLEELSKINCGLYYGFSQIGKFITVYPQDSDAAVSIAKKLHRLTCGIPSPVVPYDIPYRKKGCVYYRYGSFSSLEMEQADGARVPAIRDPAGELIPDLRGPGSSAQPWTSDPFVNGLKRRSNGKSNSNPLKTLVRAYEALSQRGKGGVYRALDLSVAPARLSVLKEGRRHGETDYYGRDGYWRVKHEARVLSALSRAGVQVPEIYTKFEVAGHYYLVTEFIEGENLQTSFSRKRKKMSSLKALQYAAQIARLLHEIHSAGWVWRDCKPLNLIISRTGTLRPLDFEGACPVAVRERTPWGTPGYVPPEWNAEAIPLSRIPEDLYALGVTLHQLFTGKTPRGTSALRPISKSSPRIPPAVRKLINALIDPEPALRPDAKTVYRRLKAIT